MRRPNTFLLRCWQLGSQEERIQIEHVQSGTTTLVRSLAAALEWICAHDDGAESVGDDSDADRMSNSTSEEL